MKRIALIDLGSNSVRFVISEIQLSGTYRLMYQHKESIRLSEGMWKENKLTKEAIQRAIYTLKGLSRLARSMGVSEVHAIATAAVRLAQNGEEFVAQVYEETGITLHPISGEEEAKLGFLGVVNTIGIDDFVVFDLGGASIEISLVKNRQLQQSVSLPMGALTLTGTFKKHQEFTNEEYAKLIAYIQELLHNEKWLKHVQLPIVGIGGTARNIGKIDQRERNYPVARLHNHRLEIERMESIFTKVKETTLEERKKISGLSSERADIIVAGMAVIMELMKYTKSKSMIVSGSGLREGLFFTYYGKHYLQGHSIIPDIVRHSTMNIVNNFAPHEICHAKNVLELTKTLCEQWQSILPTGHRYGLLVEVAALLHDWGKQVNYYSHGRHSAYMIINSNIYGLSHREQVMSAFMAAYSDGINGKLLKRSPYIAMLKAEDRDIINKYSIPLALAEALLENNEQGILQIRSDINEEYINVYVDVTPTMNISITDAAIQKLMKHCKKEFKRHLYVHWHITMR